MRVVIVSLFLLASSELSSFSGISGISGTAGAGSAHRVAFPNEFYTPGQLFKPLSIIHSTTGSGSARGHSNVAVLNGYLLVPYARDGGKVGGGLSVYDLTNPRSPALVTRVDEPILREAHGFAFSSSYGVFQTTTGIEFWDFSDVTHPVVRSRLAIDGITEDDYDLGAWWTFWQAPYVFVAGSGNGLYVVDAHDIARPRVVKRIDPTAIGNFRVGQVFAFGNLMVIASNDQQGLATLDISDPVNPTLIASTQKNIDVYSSTLIGYRILGAGKNGALHVYDVSDPRRIAFVRSSPVATGSEKGGYVSFQDGFAHVGFSSEYVKIDIRDDAAYTIVGTGSSHLDGRDEDFGSVIGNLVFMGDDHGVGSALLPHQSEPDTLGPSVVAVSPNDVAVNQRSSTRVGVAFSDSIDPTSLTGATFIVRPVGGPRLPGTYSAQFGLANFAPAEPFAAATTYEVIIPAGGVKDYVGNGVPREFRTRFSTGPSLKTPLACAVGPTVPTPVGSTATISVAASGAGPTSYSFQFGDGSPATPFAAAAASAHAYAEPGHHPLVVTVRNAAETATCSRVQTVFQPLTAPRPTGSSTILYDGQTRLAWVVNPDEDSVTAIDGLSNAKRFEAPVGAAPRTLARAPDGTIWVVNQDDASVSVLAGASGAPVAAIPLRPRSRPYGIAVSPDGTAAFVTLQGTGELVKLDPATRATTGRVALNGPVRGVAVSADSRRVLVTRFISPADHGEVIEVDAATLAVVRRMLLAKDPGLDTESSGRGVPNYLTSVAISPDGSYALVPSEKDNTDRGLVRDGRPLTFESTVRTIVSHIDLGTSAELLSRRIDFNDRDMAQAAAFSEHGDYVLVAVQGSGAVEVLDAYTGAVVTALPGVGLAPQGLAFSADFKKLYVNNFLSRNVTIHDASGLLDASRTTLPRLATVETVRTERLSAKVLRGKQIFYNAAERRMNLDGYISCASCHLDGDSDGRVWDFTDQGEGLRNTIALSGHGGMRQGFVHWTANFDEIQDFENPIRAFFRGTGFMSDAAFNTGTRNQPLGDPKAGASEDLDALAAFVAALTATPPSPFREADGSLTLEAAAGKGLFEKLGCPSCHAGPELTDDLLHDVGTLKETSGRRLGQSLEGIDTPTLKGIWETAPYLHDGSAPTLHDVLTSQNRDDLHGATSALDERELAQLVAYLTQIDESEARRASVSALSVRDDARAADWSVRASLNAGEVAYGDRSFVIAEIPAELAGLPWIRPANSSKTYRGTALVSFTVDRQATVYVSADDRVSRPTWIDASWARAPGRLVIREGARQVRPCSVYRKTFRAGTVTLGSWGTSDVNMYEIAVR